MQLNTGSDLLEVELTPEELNRAMQLCDTALSQVYLQNLRVGIFRLLATQEFTDPLKDAENQRVRAYWKGQLDILGTLVDGILNPTPVPMEQKSPQQEVFTNVGYASQSQGV